MPRVWMIGGGGTSPRAMACSSSRPLRRPSSAALTAVGQEYVRVRTAVCVSITDAACLDLLSLSSG